MKSTRQLIIITLSIFFVLTLSVNAQERKTKKVIKKEKTEKSKKNEKTEPVGSVKGEHPSKVRKISTTTQKPDSNRPAGTKNVKKVFIIASKDIQKTKGVVTKKEVSRKERVFQVSTNPEVLTKMITASQDKNSDSDSIVKIKTHNDSIIFFSKNQDFDLKTTKRVSLYKKANKENLKDKEVGTKKALSRKRDRVFQVSTSPDVMTVLKEKNSDSDSIVKTKTIYKTNKKKIKAKKTPNKKKNE